MKSFWLVAMVATIVDLASKHYVFAWLNRDADLTYYDLITNWLTLTPHINEGALWGVGRSAPTMLLIITALMIPIVIIVAYSNYEKTAPRWALGLILGGALGNFYDRLFTTETINGELLSGVRDFIYMRWETVYSWPVYNIADIAIVVGVVVFLLWNLRSSPATKK